MDFFQNQFTKQENFEEFSMLEELSRIISNDQNKNLNGVPSKEEAKAWIMGLNKHKAGGPDGMIGYFYQDT